MLPGICGLRPRIGVNTDVAARHVTAAMITGEPAPYRAAGIEVVSA